MSKVSQLLRMYSYQSLYDHDGLQRKILNQLFDLMGLWEPN